MKITVTPMAAATIKRLKKPVPGYVKLKWETEGNGCVLCGVPTLLYVEKPDEQDDLLIETNEMPVLVEKPKMVFYDDEMKIDYSADAGTFQLKSPNQTLNGRMAFRNLV